MFVSEILWNEYDFNFYFVMIECYNQGKYQVLIVYIYELYTGIIIIHLLYTLVLLGKLIPVIVCVNVFNCQALYGFPVCTALSSCKSIEDIGLWIKLPVVAFIFFFQFYGLPSTCVLVLCFYGEVHGFNFMINCPLV